MGEEERGLEAGEERGLRRGRGDGGGGDDAWREVSVGCEGGSNVCKVDGWVYQGAEVKCVVGRRNRLHKDLKERIQNVDSPV